MIQIELRVIYGWTTSPTFWQLAPIPLSLARERCMRQAVYERRHLSYPKLALRQIIDIIRRSFLVTTAQARNRGSSQRQKEILSSPILVALPDLYEANDNWS